MKTTWQKIYSFFGFWTYTEHRMEDGLNQEYTVIYWCCLPWFKYFRKFNIVRWKKGKAYDMREKLRELEQKLDAKLN